jgi:hypothetical protein
MFPSPSLDEINDGRDVVLTGHDYDLKGDYGHGGYPGRDRVTGEVEKAISWMPTFEAEYESGKYSAYYCPDNVMVLCDAGTYSSAFFVMHYLKEAGAEIAGIPSAQAGNCFGDIMTFSLPHSKVQYNVSRKYFELYPNDPDKGRIVMPDHLMTYNIMASYHFDPAMLLRFAVDLLENRE